MPTQSSSPNSTPGSGLPRRTVITAAAWAAPAISLAAAAPAYAASRPDVFSLSVPNEVIDLDGREVTAMMLNGWGAPIVGVTVSMTAPEDMTFGGDDIVTGVTDSTGRFTARLSATTLYNSGPRTVTATSNGHSATLEVQIPSNATLVTYPLGVNYADAPLHLRFRAMVLPGLTVPGLFQARVLNTFDIPGAREKFIMSDGITNSLVKPAWTELGINKWYTAGTDADGTTVDARIAWARLDGNVGVNAPLDVPIGTGTPYKTVYFEFRRLDVDPSRAEMQMQVQLFRGDTQVGTAGSWTLMASRI